MDPNESVKNIQPQGEPVPQVVPPPAPPENKSMPSMKILFLVFAAVSIVIIGGVIILTATQLFSKAAPTQQAVPQAPNDPMAVTEVPTVAMPVGSTSSSSDESAVDKIIIDDGTNDIKSLQKDAAGL